MTLAAEKKNSEELPSVDPQEIKLHLRWVTKRQFWVWWYGFFFVEKLTINPILLYMFNLENLGKYHFFKATGLLVLGVEKS